MTPRILPDRAAMLDAVTFAQGAHNADSGAMCVMECVAYVAGEPWSDHPACVSPVIAAFCRSWNDALPEPPRTQLLRPLVPVMIGTRTTEADEQTRVWMVTDWLVRVHTPAWLRLAGLTAEAQALEACARIVGATTARAAQPTIGDAQKKAAAALGASRAAARAAALDNSLDAALAATLAAARDAALAAARDAALTSALTAALDASLAAAGVAALVAAREALAPTVTTLQASAVGLIRAMCAVGRDGAA